jgi:hypothetical protein
MRDLSLFSMCWPFTFSGSVAVLLLLLFSIYMFFLSVCIVFLCLMRGVCLGVLRVCPGRLLFRVCGSCGLSAVFASSSAFGVVLVFGPVWDCVSVCTPCFCVALPRRWCLQTPPPRKCNTSTFCYSVWNFLEFF